MGGVQNKIQSLNSIVGNDLASVKNTKSASLPPVETSFVSTWKTDNISTGSSTSVQAKLPLVSTGTYNMTVDWGDGNSDVITAWNQAQSTHTYSALGTYIISISGICTGWNFENTGDRLKLLSIQKWGILKFNAPTTNGFFRGCSNLNISLVSDVINFDGITSVSGIFRGCSSLTTIQNSNIWDVSGITDFTRAFDSCTNFNSNISNWNVSNGTSFTSMFLLATSFNQNVGSWNVSNGTVFQGMFQSATSFNQDISNWNVSKATNMTGFMSAKSSANYSASNLDLIYNKWSLLVFLNSGFTISFGTIKYTVAGIAGRAILTGAPLNLTILDGGI